MKRFFSVLLMISLLSCVNQDSVKVVGHEPMYAKVGDDVILPCHLVPPFDVNNLTIEWRFKDLRSNGSDARKIYVHRSGAKDDESSDPKYMGRTSLFHDEFKYGNISLTLTKVTKEDEGNYICFVPKLESQVKRGNVTLIVDKNGAKGNLTAPEGGNGENNNRNENGDQGNGDVPGGGNGDDNKGRDIGLGVGISVGIIIIIIIFIIAGLCYWRRKQIFSCLSNNKSRHEQGRNDGDRRGNGNEAEGEPLQDMGQQNQSG